MDLFSRKDEPKPSKKKNEFVLQSTSGASQYDELVPTLPDVITPASCPSSTEVGDPRPQQSYHIFVLQP